MQTAEPRALENALDSAMILEHIGEGVCVADLRGQILWSNAALRAYSASALAAVRAALAEFGAELSRAGTAADSPRSFRRATTVGGECSFDICATAAAGADGRPEQIVAIVWDTTSSRRLVSKLEAIDAAGRALVNLDADASARLDVGERLQLLEDRIIRFCHDLMHFDHFAVRVLDKQTNRLETVLAGGFSEEAKSLTIYASPMGNGISGYVAATGESVVCPDVSREPRYLPGIEGARSSLTVPLRLHDHIVGVLNVESDRLAAFTDEDRQFAEIFGRYIAIALHILKLLAVERHAATGQVASDVASELAAPLNEIVSQATYLIQTLGSDADIRRRLDMLIGLVDRAKKTLHAATRTPGITGLVPESRSTDPLLDGRRVLVADDEDVIRETIAEVLSKHGAITIMANDGAQAVAMIESQHFDLVLSDIKMPSQNGYEVFAAARRRFGDCPVILITGFGYDPEHSIVRASKEGLAGVLFKPFRVDQLMQAVRQALTTSE